MANIWDELEKQAFGPNKKDETPSGTSVWDTLEAQAFGAEQPKRNALAAGISSGIDELQGLAYSGGAALADVAGLDKAKNWLDEQAQRNSVEAAKNGRPDLERIEDQSLGTALPYLGYQVAKQIPNLVGGIAAGALVPEVAVPAALTRGAAMLPKFLGGGALGTAEGFAAKKAALEAGKTFGKQVVGGAAFNEAQAVGSLYQAAQEGGDEHAGLKAIAGSLPYALTETLPEAMLVGRFAHGGFSGNLLSRAAKGFGTQAVTGAASEGLQNEMEMALNPNLTAEQKASNRLNSIAAGGLVEGILGGAGGTLSKSPDRQAGSILKDTTQTQDIANKPDLNAIDKAINDNSPEMNTTAPTIEQMNRQTNPLEQPAPSQEQVDQSQQQVQAAQQQAAQDQEAQVHAQAKQEFKQKSSIYGIEALPEANQYQIGGKRLFSTTQAQQFIHGLDELNQGLGDELKFMIGAAVNSGALKIGQTATPKSVNNAAVKFLSDWGLADANGVDQAVSRVDTIIAGLNGPKALKEADTLNNFYKSITGVDAPAFTSLQQAAEAQPKLTKGASNGLQLQNNAGLREVPVQSGTTETGGAGVGNVRPTGVQPVGTGSVGAGSLGLQTGAVPRSGVPTSTSTNGAVSSSGTERPGQGQGQITSERQDALTLVNQVIVKAFGTRNADIILSVLTQEKTQAEIAKEFGISDARVNQIAGPQAQETWGPRILLAARNMGISKAEMGNLLEIMSKEETTAEEQVVNEELLNEAPSEATSAQNVDDTNIATSDENLTLGSEELSKEEGPSGFRVFNPDVSGGTELEDAAAANRTRRKLKTTELEKLKDHELNNLAADENTTVEELDQIVAELVRRQELRVNKGNENAVQKQSTGKGNVRKPAGNRQEVGEANAKPEKPARAREEGETDEEAGAKAWNEGVKDFPDAPKFEELSAEQQEDWISFGEENWTPADVQTELIKLAKESATGKAQFSRKESSGETWDADGLTSLLKQLFVAKKNFDNLISVVANYDELPAYVKNAIKKSGAIQAFVYGKRVYLLADQIEIGQELPVFLHEVGVHLGMENLLGTTNYRKLAGQVMTWAQEKGTSVEHEIAKAAKKRVDAAVTAAKENNETLTADEQLDEMLAYFVEEAVARGIDPTAAKAANTQIGQWFRSLMAALKVALRKVGFGKFDKLSAGNIVDLAFGAAKMEISGAYHGTAAEFKNFRTSQIGTGEGAVAYGWGLYMAERFGIAFDYMRSDVKRKAEAEGASYKGRTILALSKASSRGALTFQERAALEVLRRAKRDNEAFGITAPAGDFISLLIKERQYTMNTETDKGLIAGEKVMIDALKKLDPKDFTEAVNKPGSVMRVLPMADEDSLMDLDTRLAAQPEVLQKIKDGFPQEVLDAIDDKSNLELGDMTGRDLQITLADLENRGITDLYFQMPDSITDSIKQGRFMSHEIVSKYLEYKLGIEGVKYFDASSRSLSSDVSIYKLPLLQKLKDRIIDQFTSGKLKAFKTGPVVVKGAYITKYVARAGSASNAPTSLTMVITSVGNFSAKQLGFSEQEIKDLTENIKDVQGRQQTKNVVMFKDKGVSRVATFPGAVKDGNVKFSLKKAREQTVAQVAKLPKPIRGPLQHIFDNVVDFAKKGVPWGAFTEDLADIASKYIPSVKKYVGLMKERQAIRTRYERNIDLILQQYDKLPSEVKGVGEKSVNRFLKDSTMQGKWAYNPGWIKNFDEAKDIDPAFKERFDAMPKEAQALIKAVFNQGHESLRAMQRAVTENINTEYDALIAAAKKAGNAQEESDLIKKKQASLTEYSSLMRAGSKTPYAPLKRFGNYVVVGRSQAYLDAEKVRDDSSSTPDQKAEASKSLRDMEKNEDHYFVQFAETMGEAKAIAREENSNYALVEPFEKDTARQALFGGKDVQGLFYRLRHMVEESSDSAVSDASERAINRLLSDLHLSLLSDQSARQAERRRRKIAGAEDDMMRAFATQGRANAHFIASLENSESIYDNLRAMRSEADARTPGREDRRRYYNEFMKRHAMGLEYQPSPFIDKALSTTSAWMLLTNPAYYLQNMTQPFMMSLPVVGGKHGYTHSWKEFTRAYNDIAGVIKKHGISEDSYSKLPADVRQVVEELVNRGRIDISLEQDLGRWRSTEDSKFAKFGEATEKLRAMAQNIETLNRVATAVAAYRLEVKKSNPTTALNYADKIIYTTHGDYSGFNAPRITRSTLGRLATQFRKFQLIQISLMTRLFHDAFAGADKETRAIGRRALMYTVGHTAVMGGAMGLPGFAVLGMLLSKIMGDDDEPEDIELMMRRAIGNDSLADLLVKGVPAALGVDISGKIGMGQMLSVLPYTDVTLSRKGVYETAGTLLTGPFGGLLAKSADGLSYIGQGDYYKGIEQLLPTGLSNVLKGARVATEGVTSRTGDLTMSPDEISFVDGFMVALGLPTKTMTDKAFLQNVKYEFDQFYNDKASEVKREYVRAYRSGDGEALTEARNDWAKLQESRAKNGYTRQPLSTLIKAPMEQTKRERNTIGGVAVNKANRGFVKQTSEL